MNKIRYLANKLAHIVVFRIMCLAGGIHQIIFVHWLSSSNHIYLQNRKLFVGEDFFIMRDRRGSTFALIKPKQEFPGFLQ